jgi:DNA-binding MarR family transcriptional regulator
MVKDDLEARIDAVRRFNRFFTRHIGVLREGLLHSPYSLTEARILFEITHREDLIASDLSRELGLDPGYLSRSLARLEQQGLIDKVRSETDARRRLLSLTLEGEDVFSLLDRRSREEVAEMLGELSEGDQRRLLEAMQTIEGVLDKSFKFSEPFFLRRHEPGDMGWVVHRHGVLYAQEYGWDERFEALVAQIVADFINNYDPAKERCWIAQRPHAPSKDVGQGDPGRPDYERPDPSEDDRGEGGYQVGAPTRQDRCPVGRHGKQRQSNVEDANPDEIEHAPSRCARDKGGHCGQPLQVPCSAVL